MGSIRVRVKPRSSRSEILNCEDGIWQVALNAPPEDGKANAELLKLLSKTLKTPVSSLEIRQGAKSRNKLIQAELLEDSIITARLSSH